MTRKMAGIADRANHCQSSLHNFFNKLAQRIEQVRLFEVAARGDVDDANLVLVSIVKHPAQTGFDVALGDASGLADLHEHDVRFRRDAAIKTVRQMTIPGGDDGRHHAVPARNV